MITEVEWRAFMDDLQQMLDKFAVPHLEQSELKAIVENESPAEDRAQVVQELGFPFRSELHLGHREPLALDVGSNRACATSAIERAAMVVWQACHLSRLGVKAEARSCVGRPAPPRRWP
jgi:hypothetical protein